MNVDGNGRVAGEEIEEVLYNLFGDKCLPDKEESKPKFDIGQKVRAKGTKQIGTIKEPYSNDVGYRVYFEDGDGGWDKEYSADELEPYTEPETKANMEEKELNLCELLKGCEGKRFYLLSRGYTTLKGIIWNKDTCDYSIVLTGKGRIELYCTGKETNNEAVVILYPSKELYEKYPLDAYSAWMEWAEARKPKYILQAEMRLISLDGRDVEDWEQIEIIGVPDIDLSQAAEAVRETLQKFHEQNAER